MALSGSLTPKAWTDRSGEARPALDMVAHAVLTAYHVTRKRQAVSTGPGSSGAPDPAPSSAPKGRRSGPSPGQVDAALDFYAGASGKCGEEPHG